MEIIPRYISYFIIIHLCDRVGACHQTIVISKDSPVTVSTPGFTTGHNYPLSILCTWDINSPVGNIHVSFTSFDIEYDATCRWDYLKLHPGPCGFVQSPRYCGKQRPHDIYTADHKLCIEFYSDTFITARGFSAQISVLDKSTTTTTGNFQSSINGKGQTTTTPIFSSTYTHHSFTASTSHQSEYPTTISKSGISQVTPKTLISKLSSSVEPTTFSATLTSSLSSDDNLTTIPSPVTSSSSSVIPTTFSATLTSSLSSDDNPTTIPSPVTSSSSSIIPTTFSATLTSSLSSIDNSKTLPSPVTSSLSSVESTTFSTPLTFPTSSSVVPTTFPTPMTTYTTITNNLEEKHLPTTLSNQEASKPIIIEMCSSQISTVTLPEGDILHIYSPGFRNGDKYPMNANCQIVIKSSHQKMLHITVNAMDLEPHPSCFYDKLIIYDGPSASYPAILSKCGKMFSYEVTSSTSAVLILFRSDHIVSAHGFNITVENAQLPLTSTESLEASNIVSGSAEPITLTPTSFLSSQFPQQATSDALATYTSESTTTPHKTSSTKVSKTTSSLNIKRLISENDHSPSTVLSTSSSPSPLTTASTTSSSSTSSSSSIPSSSSSTSSSGTFSTVTNTPINLHIENITRDIASSTNASTKYLRESSTTVSHQTTLSSIQIPENVSVEDQTPQTPTTIVSLLTKTSEVTATAVSRETYSTSRAEETRTMLQGTSTLDTTATSLTTLHNTHLPVGCSGIEQILTSHSGYILQSPTIETGHFYPNNIRCSWVVVAKRNQRIKLLFHKFDLEYQEECKYDSLTVHDGPTVQDKVLGKFCGDTTPDPITATGTELYILFKTDRVVQKSGFTVYCNITNISENEDVCDLGLKKCSSGECIQSEWFCDNESDCSDGSDEINCGQCKAGEFRCKNGDCISKYLRCDGYPDCRSHEDEEECFFISSSDSSLLVMHNNKKLPVCRDTWQSTLTHLVCAHLSFSKVEKVWFEFSNSLVHMELKDATTKDMHLSKNMFSATTFCPSGKKVHMKCQKRDCGDRSMNVVQPYIFGGSMSYNGQWPWTVALRTGDPFLCGGTLISDQWVVTAGHCVESLSYKPNLITAQLGSVSKSPQSGTSVRITEIVRHPKHDFIYNADIALLRLQRKIEVTDVVRKACIPTKSEVLSADLLCYIAGWGVTRIEDFYTTVLPDTLHHAKMKLWTNSKCKIAYASKIKESMVCAGYQYGKLDACKGDSGGPLMCRIRDAWVLVGVTTFGESPCGQIGKPGVYTRVDYFRQWINSIVTPKHANVTCDFETYDVCGYDEMSKSSFLWIRQQGGITATGKPSIDNTYKNTSGHYMYAEIPFNIQRSETPAVLKLPLKKVNTSCLSFAYVFVRPNIIDLKIFTLTANSISKLIWKTSSSISSWTRVNVTIEKDVYSINITATPNKMSTGAGVAVDDISLTNGQCQDQGMLTCDFDDGHLCNLYIEKDDFFSWQLENTQLDGDMSVCFSGKDKPYNAKSRLSSPARLQTTPYCVTLKYRACGDVIISIHTSFKYGSYTITEKAAWQYQHSHSDCTQWRSANITLPVRTIEHSVTIQGTVKSTLSKTCIDNVIIYGGDCLP